MNKTYQQLKNKIIKEIPEIMELTFGCKIKEKPAFGSGFRNSKSEFGDIFIATVKDRANNWMFPTRIGFTRVKEDELINWHEIIGRDITLSDCLRVLAKKNKRIGVDCNGDFLKLDLDCWCHNGFRWDLTKNALHQQKPEVWEFLNNLID